MTRGSGGKDGVTVKLRNVAQTTLEGSGASGGRKTTTRAPATKYRAQVATVDGIRFASKAEAKRWGILTVIEGRGLIRDLRRQVAYDLHAEGGELVGRYVADHVYEELVAGQWELVVEDTKGYPTPLYIWKRRHMRAEHGIEIREVR